MLEENRAPPRQRTIITVDRGSDDKQSDEFFRFLASNESDSAKSAALSQHWATFCHSKKDVKAVFCCVNILEILLEAKEDTKSIVAFLCFSIMKSQRIRRYVMDELLSDGTFGRDLSLLAVPDVMMVMAALSVERVSNREIGRILDYVLSVPADSLLMALVVVNKLSRSLPFVKHKHAIRLVSVLNGTVKRFLDGQIEIKDEDVTIFVTSVISIAKRIRWVLGPCNCFHLESWTAFLHKQARAHEIPRICGVPLVITDACDLPYAVKERLATNPKR